MILNGKGWHYLAVKKLFEVLKQIMSKYVGEFYCFNCLQLFRTKRKLESHKQLCENKKLFGVVMLSQDTKIVDLDHKTLCVIYADLESLIKKIDECKNNFKTSFTVKVGREHMQ